MDQIVLSEPLGIVENITFTPGAWAAHLAEVNHNASYFVNVSLIIGALVGAITVYLGIRWYSGRQG